MTAFNPYPTGFLLLIFVVEFSGIMSFRGKDR